MEKDKKFTFTKLSIQKLSFPEKGLVTYHDDKEKGLSLYLTSKGAATFFLRKRINGRDERIVLGAFPTLSVENARKLALKAKGDVAQGINPNSKRQRLRNETLFRDLFQEYMERYSKKYKRSWIYDEREVNKFLSHWFQRKISTITKQEVQSLHEKVKEENGLYQANRLLERIRAIYNKAREWGWEGRNPAEGIKKFKEKSRDRFIQPIELPGLFQALKEEENTAARDYIWLSLLTGARKSNVLAMRWDEIDWYHKEWRIPETKNGEPLHVPLEDHALEVLEARKAEATSPWVFPSEKSKRGHLADPKKTWMRVLKRANITNLRIHDIRRTLGSYQAIMGSSLPTIGASLGHRSQQATAIYARFNREAVRNSMEKAIENIFLHGDGGEKG